MMRKSSELRTRFGGMYEEWSVRVLGKSRGKVWTFFEILDVRSKTSFASYFCDCEMAELLPQVTASMYECIDAERREELYKSADSIVTEYATELVKLFDRAGDGNAAPYVRRLADRRGLAKSEPELAELALRCAEKLEKIRDDGRHARELLRPAERPPDSLLRPAGPAETTDEYLVRPADPEGSD